MVQLKRPVVENSHAYKAWLFFLGAFIGIAASVCLLAPDRFRSHSLYLTPPQIQKFSFGMREQIADFLWLRALQDFDYCRTTVTNQNCQGKDWLFKMLDLITDLSPKFRAPYATGGLALTALANDIEGASRIFDKGVEAFPFDWPILTRASYHALYEEKNKSKAKLLVKRAAENGAPPWYYLLANRIATEDGDIMFTENLIRDLESGTRPDPVLIKNLKLRLERARAGLQIDRSYER